MLLSLLDLAAVLLPVLLTVAYITLLERKVLASLQRRVGPDTVGLFGSLQPFADALKLLVKEIAVPQQAQAALFLLAPAITLVSALLGWAVIPYGPGLSVSDLELGWLFYLAAASVGIYGIIFGGWSGNSVYSLLGGIRSTAHLISYELVLGGAALLPLLLAASFQLGAIGEGQGSPLPSPSFPTSLSTSNGVGDAGGSIAAAFGSTPFLLPLLPLALIFLVAALAEVNRTPFDLVEAESELVSGFMTEHSGFVFVAYFLAEYSNIALISSIASLLWLGGALLLPSPFGALALGSQALLLMGGVIWVRGTLPRLRFDQLMYSSWSILLPTVFGLATFYLSLQLF